MLNKYISVGCLALLIGCSTWKPVVDTRVSKAPQEITRDIVECKELVKDITGFGPMCMPDGILDFDCGPANQPLRQCLINRGHSILN